MFKRLGFEGAQTKKLYREGAQTEGQVIKSWYQSVTQQMNYNVTVRAKFPDGSTTEFTKYNLDQDYVGLLYEGSVVPVRYDPSDHTKAVLDEPALEARHKEAKDAQQSQLDAQFAHLGEPGSQGRGAASGPVVAGLGDIGELRDQLLQMAAQNPGSAGNLSSSQPAGSSADPVDRLERLAKLKEQGVLSEAEFQTAKAKILADS